MFHAASGKIISLWPIEHTWFIKYIAQNIQLHIDIVSGFGLKYMEIRPFLKE